MIVNCKLVVISSFRGVTRTKRGLGNSDWEEKAHSTDSSNEEMRPITRMSVSR